MWPAEAPTRRARGGLIRITGAASRRCSARRERARCASATRGPRGARWTRTPTLLKRPRAAADDREGRRAPAGHPPRAPARESSVDARARAARPPERPKLDRRFAWTRARRRPAARLVRAGARRDAAAPDVGALDNLAVLAMTTKTLVPPLVASVAFASGGARGATARPAALGRRGRRSFGAFRRRRRRRRAAASASTPRPRARARSRRRRRRQRARGLSRRRGPGAGARARLRALAASRRARRRPRRSRVATARSRRSRARREPNVGGRGTAGPRPRGGWRRFAGEGCGTAAGTIARTERARARSARDRAGRRGRRRRAGMGRRRRLRRRVGLRAGRRRPGRDARTVLRDARARTPLDAAPDEPAVDGDDRRGGGGFVPTASGPFARGHFGEVWRASREERSRVGAGLGARGSSETHRARAGRGRG